MTGSIFSLIGGISIGFYLTYTVSDKTHQTFRKHIYMPVRKEIKNAEEEKYWTRVFNALGQGIDKSYRDISLDYWGKNK